MAKLSDESKNDTTKDTKNNTVATPAPKRSKKPNVFPAFTPRTTRSQAKLTGAAPLKLPLPTTTKRTKIPPGVGLDEIPSPVNLKIKRPATRSQAKKLDLNEVVQDFSAMGLKGEEKEDEEHPGILTESKTTKGKGKGRTKAKGKENIPPKEDDESEDGDDDDKDNPFQMSRAQKAENATVDTTQSNTRTTRAKSNIGKTATIGPYDQNDIALPTKKLPGSFDAASDSDTDPLPTTSASRTKPSPSKKDNQVPDLTFMHQNYVFPDPEADSGMPELTPMPTLDATRAMLLSFKDKATWSSGKTLWELDDTDVEKLKGAIAGKEQGKGGEVLKSMLEVVDKFRAFRDALDGYLEDVGELGLGLDWGDKDEDEVEDEEIWRRKSR